MWTIARQEELRFVPWFMIFHSLLGENKPLSRIDVFRLTPSNFSIWESQISVYICVACLSLQNKFYSWVKTND